MIAVFHLWSKIPQKKKWILVFLLSKRISHQNEHFKWPHDIRIFQSMSQHGEVEDEPKGSYKSYNTRNESQCSNDDLSLGKIEVNNQLRVHANSQLQHFNKKFQTSELQQRPKRIIMFPKHFEIVIVGTIDFVLEPINFLEIVIDNMWKIIML